MIALFHIFPYSQNVKNEWLWVWNVIGERGWKQSKLLTFSPFSWRLFIYHYLISIYFFCFTSFRACYTAYLYLKKIVSFLSQFHFSITSTIDVVSQWCTSTNVLFWKESVNLKTHLLEIDIKWTIQFSLSNCF